MRLDTGTPAGQLAAHVRRRVRAHLQTLYPPKQAVVAGDRLIAILEDFAAHHPHAGRSGRPIFDETDVVLITYADQIIEPGVPPLRTLHEFLRQRVQSVVTGVHLLPFYPSTSDDGFSVVDYEQVDPSLGDWSDVEVLAGSFRLMFDAVFNHVSASSPWFKDWLVGDPARRDFFLALDPHTDVSTVTRPRASPLLTPVEAPHGTRYVWTTFSPDQIDLDYANPEVLLEVTRILLSYVTHGASLIRLDAVAFLWKEHGSSCLHLPQTHEIIRLWRTVLDAVAPGTVLITETNVPHEENISYFGNGHDEAHIVYQFPLAPLVLSAFHLADATTLAEWIAGISAPSDETAFLNFLGSHDGIGLRPAERLLTRAEIDQLCRLATAHGAGVSYRSQPDGTLAPYELNTVYFDALTEADSDEPVARQVDRFIAAQSILLALAGVPGVYVQAVLGSRNWHEGVQSTGRLRTINRQKFLRHELEAELDTPGSLRHVVFHRFRERIGIRIREPAFHPNGAQRVVWSQRSLLSFERSSPDGQHTVLCLHNLSGRRQRFAASAADGVTVRGGLLDLCSGRRYRTTPQGAVNIDVPPYGVMWLLSEPVAP
jgi:glucosylglycerate phosphorylase